MNVEKLFMLFLGGFLLGYFVVGPLIDWILKRIP